MAFSATCALCSVKEQYVCLHSLRIKQSCRQAKKRVNIACLEDSAAHYRGGSRLKQNIVRNNDCSPATWLKHGDHVLQEVQLLICGLYPEIRSNDINSVADPRDSFRPGIRDPTF